MRKIKREGKFTLGNFFKSTKNKTKEKKFKRKKNEKKLKTRHDGFNLIANFSLGILSESPFFSHWDDA